MRDDKNDELYSKALELVVETGHASSAFLQRRLSMGYSRAARIIEKLEVDGFLGPANGPKPRDLIINNKTKALMEKISREAREKLEEHQRAKDKWYSGESEKYKDYDASIFFPWTDVANCLENKISFYKYRTEDDFRNDPKNHGITCPKCNNDLHKLNVVYFRSPDWTWGEELCGRAGWLVICPDCKKQVNFDMELMS